MSFASCSDLTALESSLLTQIENLKVVDATESVKGKVELATAIETAAGIDNTRAVTPFGLKHAIDEALALELTCENITNLVECGIGGDPGAQDAIATAIASQVASAISTTPAAIASIVSALPVSTTSVRGIVELATASEVQQGTDSQRAITPDSLRTALSEQLTAGGNPMQKAVVSSIKNALGSDAGTQAVIADLIKDDVANSIAADSTSINILMPALVDALIANPTKLAELMQAMSVFED